MAADDRTPTAENLSDPWYADGLHFECQPDCAACCTNHDDYSYVYLDDGEDRRIAEHLELTLRQFRKTYTTRDDGWIVLKMDQPDCPFLDGARCGIYPVRPVQCSTFPFWRENLRSPGAWKRLREFCPGIGAGEEHSLPVIQTRLAQRKPGD